MGLDSADNPVLGFRSTSEDFPTTPGAYDRTYNDHAPGHGDVVVAKLDNTLSTLLASTFIGGALWDEARSLHVDSDDTVLVGGNTVNSSSFGAIYPTTAGAYSTCSNTLAGHDAFVSRLSVDFSTLIASTCIGPDPTNELIVGIKTTADGSVVVIGRTGSSVFPVTVGAFDTTFNGGTEDAFVAKFDSGLTTLAASTYLGGNVWEYPHALMIDPAGMIHVTGGTRSTDFPTTVDGYDTSHDGLRNGFHVQLAPDLDGLEYGTFIGGSVEDSAAAAFLIGPDLYLHGWSRSADFPTSPGAYDENHNGGKDGYITRLGPLAACPDADGDSVCDADDNCPDAANPGQENVDGDTTGDVCDPCPIDANDTNPDGDDYCDADTVGGYEPCNTFPPDAFCLDNCPGAANNQLDTDDDGEGDVCDVDDD
ncbi:MAG: hypothetical protein GY708_20945, partial [Actinomycetia bacterium]|nr:hypothetical protein [Actinomycetes bacterium]